jgi:ribosomal-protein-alanine N-acetyltransferase
VTAVLQPIREADLVRLAQLHAECFPDDAWNSSALATVLAMPGADGRVFLATGGAALGLLLDQCLGPEGEILTLGVAPFARRQGVARALLVDLIARARAARVRRLLLEVAADNAAAIALYDAFSFTRHGIRRRYYRRVDGPAVDAWRLGLELPPLTPGQCII